jgi:hypothetical protein
MTATANISSTRQFRAQQTSGLSQDALASCGLGHEPKDDEWEQLKNALLKWRHNGEAMFEPDECPSKEIIDGALDFVMDWRATQPAPLITSPSGDGRLVMEWRTGTTVMTIEFMAHGVFEVTEFEDGRVIHCETYERDPLTRREQMRTR